jgi:hypothetical protein
MDLAKRTEIPQSATWMERFNAWFHAIGSAKTCETCLAKPQWTLGPTVGQPPCCQLVGQKKNTPNFLGTKKGIPNLRNDEMIDCL